MSQAGAARARSIESIGDSLTNGIKQYQQNQNFTQQSLAKFYSNMQDPDYKDLVTKIIADDSNQMGVPSNLKKAIQNAGTGKIDAGQAAMLATWAQDFSEKKRASIEEDYKKAHTMLAYAQASGAIAKANAVKPGQVMTQEEFLKLDPALEARGKPIGDGSGRILVESMSNRAPASPVTPVSVSAGGGTLVDPKTGAMRIIPAIPQADPGYILEGNAPAGPQTAPATTISPDVLAKFAPSSRMAPAAGGLLAQTSPQATPTVSPQTVEAIRAVQSQAAPAGPTPTTPSGVRMEVIPGSKAAQEAQAKRQAEVSNYQLQMQNFDTVINAVDRVLPNVSARSTGLGSLLKYVPETKANQVAADLTTLTAREAFQGLEDIKKAGGSLGQVAIYEIKLLENARLALNHQGSPKDLADALKSLKKTTQDSKKRLEILARDRPTGLEVPSKEYFKAGGKWPGVSEDMPTVENAQGGATGGGNVVRLNVQRGSTAGSSTFQPAEFDFSPFEGKVLNTPDGKRVRIVNGKQVPL
jgi:hypothetical protein